MKKIIVLGCFALLAAVGCKKTTNVYYVDPNQSNGNPGNTYTGPVNDTIAIVKNHVLDSSMWTYDPFMNQFYVIIDHTYGSDGFIGTIMDVLDDDGYYYETPSPVKGGAKLSHMDQGDAVKIILSTTSKNDPPWIPQEITISLYAVIER